MLIPNPATPSQPWPFLQVKKISLRAYVFHFPSVKGLEDISTALNAVKAESPFSALYHIFSLRPIASQEEANKAERLLEYLERVFENKPPEDIANYAHILLLLIDEYDARFYEPVASNMTAHQFLKILIEEEGIKQKDLVPDCFRSESQVSEFIHQKTGRKHLKYEQAVALGKMLGVSFLNFLKQ